MVNIYKLIKNIENHLIDYSQENWDNSGWQINLNIPIINKVLLCVSITENVIDFAVENKFDFIISHHPVIFPSIKCIENKLIIKAIQNNIQIYSIHTNFDKFTTTKSLIHKLGFNDIFDFNDYVKYVNVSNFNINNFITKIKKELNINNILSYNLNLEKDIKKIAFCSGSGGDFLYDFNNKFDLYITSDIKYHQTLDNVDTIIFDIGHLESEKPALDIIKNIINKKNKVEILIYDEKTNLKII